MYGYVCVRVCSAVLLEVAHFASVSDVSREVCVLRSDNGVTWSEHPGPATDDSVNAVFANNFESKQFTALQSPDAFSTHRIVHLSPQTRS